MSLQVEKDQKDNFFLERKDENPTTFAELCTTSLRSSGAVIKCFPTEVFYLSNWPASRGDVRIFL